MDRIKIIAKVNKKLSLESNIRKELLKFKPVLKKFIDKNEFEKFNSLLIKFAEDWKIINDQNNFGDLLQMVADWKLNFDLKYKKNLMSLGKKYNVIGLFFKQ